MAGRFKAEVPLRRSRFCTTSRGIRTADNAVCVLKEITTDELKTADRLQKAITELKTLAKLQSPELVKFIDVIKADVNRRKWILVTEFCQGGSLRQRITEQHAKKARFTEKQILDWFFSVATAINFLHGNNVAHGGLNCQNILFEDSSCTLVKISDYGLAKFRDLCKLPYETTEDTLASWCYRAPEVSKGQLDLKSDIWSMGILLFELAAFDLPFHGFNQSEMTAQMTKPISKQIPNHFSVNYRNLMLRMIQYRPSNRPCSADVLFDDCLQDHVLGQFESMTIALGGCDGPATTTNKTDDEENISGLSEEEEEDPQPKVDENAAVSSTARLEFETTARQVNFINVKRNNSRFRDDFT